MTDSVQTVPAGTRFGQYEVVKLLGKGGMGSVYEAVHVGIKKRVALKTLHPHIAEKQNVVTRFMREGQAASRVRHPHVVDVSDVGMSGTTPYMVMEFLEGEDLAQLIEREGPLEIPRIIDIMLPVLSAVSAAHEAGVVHRDLKPENVFLTKGRSGEVQPKVLDFGISRVLDDDDEMRLTKTSAVLGSPYYMSPEQTRGGKNIDARSDQYSLGVIVYEAVTRTKPFQAKSLFDLMQAIVSAPITPPSFFRSVPLHFDDVVLRAMSRQLQDRYPSVGALAKDLLQFATDRTRAIWSAEFENERTSLPTAGSNTASADQDAAAPASVPLATTMGSAAGEVAASSERPKSRRGTWIAVAGLGVAIAGGAAYGLRGTGQNGNTEGLHAVTQASSVPTTPVNPPPQVPSTYHVSVGVTPDTATIVLDGQPVGNGHFDRDLPRDGTSHDMRIASSGYEPQQLTFRDAPPPPQVVLTALPAPPQEPAALVPTPPPSSEHGSHSHGSHGHGDEGHASQHTSGEHTSPNPTTTNPTAPTTPTPPTSANGAPILQ